MIAAAAAITITKGRERSPWAANTLAAMSAVSPGTGIPADSSMTARNNAERP